MQASEQPAQLNSNASLTTAQDPGRAISSTQPNPSPTLPHRTKPSQGSGGVQPGSSPSTTPSYGLGMKQAQDSSWDGAKNSPSLSVGQRMKKSQASWLPQPLSACPLTTSAPSPAAYALPQQAKRAATAELHCAVLQKQCPSQVSGHMVSVPCNAQPQPCLHTTRSFAQRLDRLLTSFPALLVSLVSWLHMVLLLSCHSLASVSTVCITGAAYLAVVHRPIILVVVTAYCQLHQRNHRVF